ncbi:endonuclease VII domain-containing protein [Streptomyces piniterrae]|uniref:endonuclease VII domain-containing protein n=1 Tax=Streptomyces piniterrae TaxID=2571125 RepID=UPI001FE36E3F|nr:endonuclease VII domain-containing protein [Streptomyces piniterrae]
MRLTAAAHAGPAGVRRPAANLARQPKGGPGHVKRRHGIGEAERDATIKERRGSCSIRPESDALHVDHDHKTGKVRGVRCFSCNAALGQFKDRPDVLRRTAEYVEGNAWKPTLQAPGVCQQPS